MLHRNSQKRIYFPEAIYFITICTQDRFPFFKEEIFCELFIEELKLAKQLKPFRLFGFVVLHDHVHLLIQPNDGYNISKIIQFLKRHFSRDINYILHPTEGAIRESRLRNGHYQYFTNVINKHDDKIKQYQNQFVQKHGQDQFQFPKFQWQKSFYDHYIRSQKDLDYHLEYIWRNPEKHGIINNYENYKYSSYNNSKDLIDNFN